MSFFRIQTQHYLANTPDSCKVSLTRLAGRAKARFGIRLSIGANVIGALGADFGDKLDLLWGRDVDFGKVMLKKYESGVALKKLKDSKLSGGYMTFAAVPVELVSDNRGSKWKFADGAKSARAAEWQAADGGVVITLPADWWTVVESENKSALKAICRDPLMPAARAVA